MPVANRYLAPSDHPVRIPAMIFVNGAGNLLKNYKLVLNVKDDGMEVSPNAANFVSLKQ